MVVTASVVWTARPSSQGHITPDRGIADLSGRRGQWSDCPEPINEILADGTSKVQHYQPDVFSAYFTFFFPLGYPTECIHPTFTGKPVTGGGRHGLEGLQASIQG